MMVDDAHREVSVARLGSVDTSRHYCRHPGRHIISYRALGGYVCGSRDLIDYLYHRARPFLFSTSHPPSVAATCIAAFDILENEPDRMPRLWDNTIYFKQQLTDAGFDVGGNSTPKSETPITPIIIGDGRRTMDFSRALFDAGVMATFIAFPCPGAKPASAPSRPANTRAEIDKALEVFTSARKMVSYRPKKAIGHSCRGNHLS
jgi:glycine C-acetyltransferase